MIRKIYDWFFFQWIHLEVTLAKTLEKYFNK